MPGLQIFRTPIVEPAPFSDYAGSDRIFTVVNGANLELQVDGLTVPAKRYAPVRFAGDANVSVALPFGEAEVLNVIYDRKIWRELAVAESTGNIAIAILHLAEPALDTGIDLDETVIGPANMPVPQVPGLLHFRLARR